MTTTTIAAIGFLFAVPAFMLGYWLGRRVGIEDGAYLQRRFVGYVLDQWAQRNPLDAKQLRNLIGIEREASR